VYKLLLLRKSEKPPNHPLANGGSAGKGQGRPLGRGRLSGPRQLHRSLQQSSGFGLPPLHLQFQWRQQCPPRRGLYAPRLPHQVLVLRRSQWRWLRRGRRGLRIGTEPTQWRPQGCTVQSHRGTQHIHRAQR